MCGGGGGTILRNLMTPEIHNYNIAFTICMVLLVAIIAIKVVEEIMPKICLLLYTGVATLLIGGTRATRH